MFLDPRALFMLAVLVGVTGLVAKSIILVMFRVKQGSQNNAAESRMAEMDERLRNIEAATSSLLVDISSIKEKQRFMTRLQAGVTRETPQPENRAENDPSPMVTQSIPIIPRSTPR